MSQILAPGFKDRCLRPLPRSSVGRDNLTWCQSSSSKKLLMAKESKKDPLLKSEVELMAWANTLNLSEIVALKFMDILKLKDAENPLQALSSLFQSSVNVQTGFLCQDIVSQVTNSLKEKITNELKTLGLFYGNVSNNSNPKSNNPAEKFQQSSSKSPTDLMSDVDNHSSKSPTDLISDIDNFHAGLGNRVGHPFVKFREAMQQEHCAMYGFSKPFTTKNYGITTTPAEEWRLVTEKEDREKKNLDPTNSRKIPDLLELKGSARSSSAGLEECEIIALVLYTGPMYHIYNMILRRMPRDDFKLFEEKGNMYSTTIYVLSSAVQKLARTEKIRFGTKLYRGFGGFELPESFFDVDCQGCKGMLEWGFMSTTRCKEVAVQYSNMRPGQGCDIPVIFEIETSSVDKGASITEFSQYPGEQEILWVPCSFVEPQERSGRLEITEKGLVRIIRVRVNANFKASTIHELVEQKKEFHIKGFQFMLGQIEAELKEMTGSEEAKIREARDFTFRAKKRACSLEVLVKKINDFCKSTFEKHRKIPAAEYLDDNHFRSLVVESLEVKEMAKAKFEWWLKDESESIEHVIKCSMSRAYRAWIMLLERNILVATMDSDISGDTAVTVQSLALALCKQKGLIRESFVDECSHGDTNMQINLCFLHAAAAGECLSNLQLLLTARADIHTIDSRSKRTAVMWAAHYGHVHTLKALRILGADFTKSSTGGSAVIDAAQNGHCDTLKKLFMFGSDFSGCQSDGWNPVMAAALYGHAQTIRTLVRLKADVNEKKKDGSTALIFSASNGHCEAIQTLNELKANVDVADKEGLTAVMAAARNGHEKAIKTLVALKANVNLSKVDGSTALMLAVENQHVLVIQALLQMKSNLHTSKIEKVTHTPGYTPLMCAAENGYADVIEALVAWNAEVDAKMKNGSTAFMLAAGRWKHDSIKVLSKHLVDKNADLINMKDEYGDTALMQASKWISSAQESSEYDDCVETINTLVDLKAKIDEKNVFQYNAAMIAAESGNLSALQALIRKGACLVHQTSSTQNTTILMCAAKRTSDMKDKTSQVMIQAIIKEFKEKNENSEPDAVQRLVNHQNEDGCSALMWASRNGNSVAVEKLLQLRANVDLRRNDQSTALIIAAEYGHIDVLKLLYASKADIECQMQNGCTALMVAAEKGNKKILEYLVDKRADIEKSAGDGWTALMAAAENGNSDTIKTLVEAKVDVSACKTRSAGRIQSFRKPFRNLDQSLFKRAVSSVAHEKSIEGEGWNALMSAAKNGHTDSVRELIKLKVDVNASTRDGKTALMVAAWNGHCEVLRSLMALNANVNASTTEKWNSITWAADHGHLEAIRLLIESKAEYLDLARDICVSATGGYCAVIEALAINRVDAVSGTAKDLDGKTAIMLAAENGHSRTIATLHRLGADIKATSHNGMTALMLASQNGHIEAINILCSLRADPNARSLSSWSAIAYAAEGVKFEAARLLRRKGANFEHPFQCAKVLYPSVTVAKKRSTSAWRLASVQALIKNQEDKEEIKIKELKRQITTLKLAGNLGASLPGSPCKSAMMNASTDSGTPG